MFSTSNDTDESSAELTVLDSSVSGLFAVGVEIVIHYSLFGLRIVLNFCPYLASFVISNILTVDIFKTAINLIIALPVDAHV